MAKLTALVHTHNDERRIGRAIESLRACDEILVIDHGSTDDTAKMPGHQAGDLLRFTNP
jgi:glycosyltransferase involved in cell wall biosynthesis